MDSRLHLRSGFYNNSRLPDFVFCPGEITEIGWALNLLNESNHTVYHSPGCLYQLANLPVWRISHDGPAAAQLQPDSR